MDRSETTVTEITQWQITDEAQVFDLESDNIFQVIQKISDGAHTIYRSVEFSRAEPFENNYDRLIETIESEKDAFAQLPPETQFQLFNSYCVSMAGAQVPPKQDWMYEDLFSQMVLEEKYHQYNSN